MNRIVLSCVSDAFSLAPDLYFSLERDREGSVNPLDSRGRLGVEPFGVKPLVGRAGTAPSSMISCWWSSLTENVSEWKDKRSLFDPGTKSLSRGITSPNVANWKSLQCEILEHHQHFVGENFLIATEEQGGPCSRGGHYVHYCICRCWIPKHPTLPGHNPTPFLHLITPDCNPPIEAHPNLSYSPPMQCRRIAIL